MKRYILTSDKNIKPNAKKIIFSAMFAIFVAGFVFSQEEAESSESGAGGEATEITGGGGLMLMPDNWTPEKQAEKDAAKAKKQEAKDEKKAEAKGKGKKRVDEYTGHVYTIEKNPYIQNDFLRVEALEKPGTVSISAVNKAAREQVSLLAKQEKSSTTFFSLLYGKDLYQLNKSSNVVQELRKTEESVQIMYKIPNRARVLIDFKPVGRKSEEEYDYVKGDGVLKVCIYTTNLGAREEFLSVKGVFDTYLGENSTHFKTAGDKDFNKEAKFAGDEIGKRQWVLSENDKYSIQFLFFGKSITTPEAVYLGSRDNLMVQKWNPPVRDERGFNTVLSYNNSAVGINWEGELLNKNQTSCTVFYIALTPIKVIEIDDRPPVDAPIEPVDAPPDAPFVFDGEQQVTEDGNVIDPNILKAAEKALQETGYNNYNAPNNQPSPQMPQNLPPVTKEQLDPVYIQQLIDRIYSLQNDPQLIDRSEIRRLNAELDSILMKIREQKR